MCKPVLSNKNSVALRPPLEEKAVVELGETAFIKFELVSEQLRFSKIFLTYNFNEDLSKV